MSFADQTFIDNVRDILENGTWDTDTDVRPKWADGTPAHTISVNHTYRVFIDGKKIGSYRDINNIINQIKNNIA